MNKAELDNVWIRVAAVFEEESRQRGWLPQGCGDPLCKDPNCSYGKEDDALRAEARQLRSEVERLRDGIQAYIDGDYGRSSLFRTKQDVCHHGRFAWESCEPCIDEYFSKLIGLPPAVTRTPVGGAPK